MDLILVVIIITVIGIPRALRTERLMKEKISYVAAEQGVVCDVPIGNNLNNITEPDAFMLIVRRLGLM